MLSPIKIIGLGNIVRGDDAIGYLVLQELQRNDQFPLSLVNGGIAGLNLLYELEGMDAVILIDAVSSQSEAGTIHRLTIPQDWGKIRQWTWSSSVTSTHAFGLGEALTLAETLGILPPQTVIYGIELGTVTIGNSMSPGVEESIQTVATQIIDEAGPFSHA